MGVGRVVWTVGSGLCGVNDQEWLVTVYHGAELEQIAPSLKLEKAMVISGDMGIGAGKLYALTENNVLYI